MAFIVGKKQDGKTYYYLAESARVDGKPRIVSQRYLGSAEEIAARLSESGPGEPDRSRHLAFGDVAATFDMLRRLRVAEIVDEVVGSRRVDAGASVGTYIALAALNRVVDPCSKLAFSDWWHKTAGDRWLRLPAGALDHRRFWDAMDQVSQAQLEEIERRVVEGMVETFGVDLSGLVLDMTNFATWIDSANERAPIAQRGHSKQKRSDLRICGLGLVVSTDGGVPLVSLAYPGNRPDVTQFATMVNELVARFGTLYPDGKGERLTLVYDAGQNSGDNYETLDHTPLHFVGSLPPSDHPELLATAKNRYKVVDKQAFPGLTAFETTKVVFGKQRRLVCCHFRWTARQAVARLRPDPRQGAPPAHRDPITPRPGPHPQIQGGSPGRDSCHIGASLGVPGGLGHADRRQAGRASPRVPHRRQGPSDARRRAVRQADPVHRQDTRAGLLGNHRRRVPFPRSGGSRLPPDEGPERRLVLADVPLHEQKIRVHIFYCVLALMVAKLMVREADRAGMHMSVRALLSSLSGIEETVLLYKGERGRPRARRMLTEQDATQHRLYDLFGLDAYAPTR